MNARALAAAAFGSVFAFAAGVATLAVAPVAPPPPATPQVVAEGKYLAAAGDCTACHTVDDAHPYAGGVVIGTPFGKLLGSNITPDKTYGIGGWSDARFVAALKYGRGHNGIRLYPGMPYIYFNKAPASDILKIRAYLNTVPPSHTRIVSNQLPFPFNIRFLMFGWNLLFFDDHGDFQPVAAQSAAWNRGAYLVEGFGHCAACHTPKNLFGGDVTARAFEGGAIDSANAPALVASRVDGIGGWSVQDIAQYLKTGHNAYADASGPMASVITHSTSQLTLADDAAIGTYLKTLTPKGPQPPAPLAATDAAMVAGSHVYEDECAACHGSDGVGQPNLFPALAGNPVVAANPPETLVHIVLQGAQSVGTTTAGAAAMPAYANILTDRQIADVLTYIRNSWGNAGKPVRQGIVSKQR